LPPPQGALGLVSHVRIVAILMMVQGALEMLLGVFYGVFGVLMATVMREGVMEGPGFPADSGLSPDAFVWLMIAVYAGLGLVNFVIGVLHAYAGYRNYQFKSRTLGIIALAAGMLTVVGCYCMPTAIALAIYGLIVYLNASVAVAFQMGEQGHSGAAISATFSQHRPPIQP
jgi:hypothetical protein